MTKQGCSNRSPLLVFCGFSENQTNGYCCCDKPIDSAKPGEDSALSEGMAEFLEVGFKLLHIGDEGRK